MRRLHLLLPPLLLAGCAMDFAPASLLDESRILALIPNPIEIDLRDANREIELQRVAYVPITATITASRWSFCPISTGVRGGFECVLPACQVELDEVGPGHVRVSPATLAATCLSLLEAEGVAFGDSTQNAPESFETSFRHRLETNDGASAEGVARVRAFITNAPSPAHEHPRFSRITLAGVDVANGAAPFRVAEGKSVPIEVEVEPGAGATPEDLYVSYSATAGRFDRLRTDQTLGQNTWTAEELIPEDQESRLYFVARDGRGGQAVAGPYVVGIVRTAP